MAWLDMLDLARITTSNVSPPPTFQPTMCSEAQPALSLPSFPPPSPRVRLTSSPPSLSNERENSRGNQHASFLFFFVKQQMYDDDDDEDG